MPININYRTRRAGRRPRRARSAARRPRGRGMRRMPRRRVPRPLRAEVKKVQFSARLGVGVNNNPVIPGAIFSLTPNIGSLLIAQGVGQGNRIGNRVSTRRLTFKGYLLPSLITGVPVYVKLWVLSYKPNRTQIAVPDGSFIQVGNTTNFLTGTITDLLSTVNTDVWTVKKTKVWKLGFASYTTGIGETNNDFSRAIMFSLDITKYVPKLVIFNDAANNPTTETVYAYLEALDAGGSTNLLGITYPAAIDYFLDYSFTDV